MTGPVYNMVFATSQKIPVHGYVGSLRYQTEDVLKPARQDAAHRRRENPVANRDY
jgi:hypothetical protein